MNTPAQPVTKFCIKAKYLGPIMNLDSELSENSQNLIFATNGTGKSFLARAFRMLDETAYASVDPTDIANALVSEEASSGNGKGAFCFQKGNGVLGQIDLDTNTKSASRSNIQYLYHVFSTDYVEVELKSKKFEIEDNIEHEIIVGKENAELDTKKDLLTSEQTKLKEIWATWRDKFNSQKTKLKTDFSINAQLGEYRGLLEDYWSDNNFTPDDNLSIANVLTRYNEYKSFPSDPQLPTILQNQQIFCDLEDLSELLEEVISLSTVSDEIKSKIQSKQDFFKIGLEQHSHDSSHCYFCTQSLNEAALKAIKAYQEYFADEEAKTIRQLRAYKSKLELCRSQINLAKTNTAQTD